MEFIYKYSSKLLLIIELPFYPIMYSYLWRNIQTKEGRKKLYLKAGRTFFLRRLAIWCLYKIHAKVALTEKRGDYAKFSGLVYDLRKEMEVGCGYKNKLNYKGNFHYAIDSLYEVLKNQDVKLIVDYGCSEGMMARIVRKIVSPTISVVGSDQRPEIMEYNSILYPGILWVPAQELQKFLAAYRPENVVFICNAMANFMALKDLLEVVSHGYTIIWLYITFVHDLKVLETSEDYILNTNTGIPACIDYNLVKILKDNGYEFNYQPFPHPFGRAFYIHGVSRKILAEPQ